MQNFRKHMMTEVDMLAFGHQLSATLLDGAMIFLYGPLGVGKTTLTRGVLQGLGYKGKVKSPTYALLEPYQFASLNVFHFDFYRLNDPKELEYIGIQDYFTETAICLVEWPEKGGGLLPKPDLACYIDFNGEARELEIEALTERGQAILGKLKE